MDTQISSNGSETEKTDNSWRSKSKAEIVELLKTGFFNIKFQKWDGTERFLVGTLVESVLPEREKEAFKRDESYDYHGPEKVAVWDVDLCEWRSFKIERLISIEPSSYNPTDIARWGEKEYFLEKTGADEELYELFEMLIKEENKVVYILFEDDNDTSANIDRFTKVLSSVPIAYSNKSWNYKPSIFCSYGNNIVLFSSYGRSHGKGTSIDYLLVLDDEHEVPEEIQKAFYPCVRKEGKRKFYKWK